MNLNCTVFLFFLTVPEMVENLNAAFILDGNFDTTTQQWEIDLNITWERPTNPNGIITNYSVTVYQTDNSSNVVYRSSRTQPNVVASVMVAAYVNYTVTVSAFTSAGEGEDNSFITISPEAGMF